MRAHRSSIDRVSFQQRSEYAADVPRPRPTRRSPLRRCAQWNPWVMKDVTARSQARGNFWIVATRTEPKAASPTTLVRQGSHAGSRCIEPCWSIRARSNTSNRACSMRVRDASTSLPSKSPLQRRGRPQCSSRIIHASMGIALGQTQLTNSMRCRATITRAIPRSANHRRTHRQCLERSVIHDSAETTSKPVCRPRDGWPRCWRWCHQRGRVETLVPPNLTTTTGRRRRGRDHGIHDWNVLADPRNESPFFDAFATNASNGYVRGGAVAQ